MDIAATLAKLATLEAEPCERDRECSADGVEMEGWTCSVERARR